MEAPFASCAPLSLSLYPCRGRGNRNDSLSLRDRDGRGESGGLIAHPHRWATSRGRYRRNVHRLRPPRGTKRPGLQLQASLDAERPGGALVEGLGGRALAEPLKNGRRSRESYLPLDRPGPLRAVSHTGASKKKRRGVHRQTSSVARDKGHFSGSRGACLLLDCPLSPAWRRCYWGR